jgi:hypothetical protein
MPSSRSCCRPGARVCRDDDLQRSAPRILILRLSSLAPLAALAVGVVLDLLLIPSFGAPWRRSLGAFAAGGTVALGLFRTQARFSRAYICRVGGRAPYRRWRSG